MTTVEETKEEQKEKQIASFKKKFGCEPGEAEQHTQCKTCKLFVHMHRRKPSGYECYPTAKRPDYLTAVKKTLNAYKETEKRFGIFGVPPNPYSKCCLCGGIYKSHRTSPFSVEVSCDTKILKKEREFRESGLEIPTERKRCDFNAAVFSYYIPLTLQLFLTAEKERTPSILKLQEDLDVYMDNMNEVLAKRFHDYFAVISFGEARHGNRLCRFKIPEYPSQLSFERHEVYESCVLYELKDSLKKLQALFNHEWRTPRYGGTKWAGVVEAALKYGTMPDHLYVDHGFDVVHNGGRAFGKPVLFSNVSHVSFQILNVRRDKNIFAYLDGFFKNHDSVGLKPSVSIPCLARSFANRYLRVAKEEKYTKEVEIIKRTKAKDVPALADPDDDYAMLNWGVRTLSEPVLNPDY